MLSAQAWDRLVFAAFLTVTCAGVRPGWAEGFDPVCQGAGVAAERQMDLPPGLLLAIGRVESGRRDPATGRVIAWPWTINANGAGHLFETLGEALAETRGLQQRGITSIDVGCFQINLLQHPEAFATLEEAFDPQANATYAARFLSKLRSQTGSWEKAVAAYHSSTPERGDVYRDQVLTGFVGLGGQVVFPALNVQSRAVRPSVTVSNGVRVWTPSPRGTAPGSINIRLSLARQEPVMPAIRVLNRINDSATSN